MMIVPMMAKKFPRYLGSQPGSLWTNLEFILVATGFDNIFNHFQRGFEILINYESPTSTNCTEIAYKRILSIVPWKKVSTTNVVKPEIENNKNSGYPVIAKLSPNSSLAGLS